MDRPMNFASHLWELERGISELDTVIKEDRQLLRRLREYLRTFGTAAIAIPPPEESDVSCGVFLVTGLGCSGPEPLPGSQITFYDDETGLIAGWAVADSNGLATFCLEDGKSYRCLVQCINHSDFYSDVMTWPWTPEALTVSLSYPECADCWPQCNRAILSTTASITDWTGTRAFTSNCDRTHRVILSKTGFTGDCSILMAGSPFRMEYRMQPYWTGFGYFTVNSSGVVVSTSIKDGGAGYTTTSVITGTNAGGTRKPRFTTVLTGDAITGLTITDAGSGLTPGTYQLPFPTPSTATHPLTVEWYYLPCNNDGSGSGSNGAQVGRSYPSPDYFIRAASFSPTVPTSLILPLYHATPTSTIQGRASLRVKPTSVTCGANLSASYTFASLSMPTIDVYYAGSTTPVTSLTAPNPWGANSRAVTVTGTWI